ncbi:MAG TPA: FAD-dependent oxidoreductase [Tepidanaerobacter syntrophicus]|uniref:NAD(P)/FAD-dependent oxidoreductase n=1 Tax=Tepidanaerobacter syntrophicus TaxID=224999 RepID=UPI0017582628|nr:NAD(P)/FAD-dependent oxidoreductase [Tepidanaerobacter syntrophicus]HHV82969.1 FAD-dependent oxidoreductase [Tepidanaerobacter syntrophicus]
MKRADIAVIGAGPAGLSCAVEAAKAGAKVVVLDENLKPGGQLFKQIHKFFGSREHRAGTRGFRIGQQLLEETEKLGVEVVLDAAVYGIYEDRLIAYITNGKDHTLKAEKIVLATGASENALAFPGCTLPGVMGAGAAQTMINVNRVLPGEKILMVGSGNVGLIVSYQLMQAGADVVALIEAAPKIGGYGVHASKIRRAGVPIYVSTTIKEIIGEEKVEEVVTIELDRNWQQIPGTEKNFEADTVCLAVGLSPLTELAWMAGCEFVYIPPLGGQVPIHDRNMETTLEGVYVAGDITGVEEASSAMEEGRLAGVACAESLGYYDKIKALELKNEIWNRLDALRTGPFGEGRFQAKLKQVNARGQLV